MNNFKTLTLITLLLLYGACAPTIPPTPCTPQLETCNGKDDDCDGKVDEDLVTKSCYTGPIGTEGVGICKGGSQKCENGELSSCSDEVIPQKEKEGDKLDNNCNGKVDEEECISVDEICNGKDEDCDGEIDEDLEIIDCYPGSKDTLGVGTCKKGTQKCVDGKPTLCSGAITPQEEIPDDGLDNDCNGKVDEETSCKDGDTRICFPDGSLEQINRGPCKAGMSRCVSGRWSSCIGHVPPENEICDQIDNDCDGAVDEASECKCTKGETQKCYTGPANSRGRGNCSFGTQTCNSNGAWGKCEGSVLPKEEVLNGEDDDCDGITDNELKCTYHQDKSKNEKQYCYTGPYKTQGSSDCTSGEMECVKEGKWPKECTNEVLPKKEICNQHDDDCDGYVDEGCGCTPGKEQSCYTGSAESRNIGRCQDGKQRCNTFGKWGKVCNNIRIPEKEKLNGIDDDCDGTADEGLTCTRGSSRPCYPGPTITEGKGMCKAGTQYCVEGKWSDKCTGAVTPKPVDCNSKDNNCDGVIDIDCECTPGQTQSCYSGPSETIKLGTCKQGKKSCLPNGKWGKCTNEILPIKEVCDGLDNNCNGKIDEPCLCKTGEFNFCFPGNKYHWNRGKCVGGIQACVYGKWGPCQKYYKYPVKLPEHEKCNDSDDDCDGLTDEGCHCNDPSYTQACFTGPIGAYHKGKCTNGTQKCILINNGKYRYADVCRGEIRPTPEICTDHIDNDCDGKTDEDNCLP